MKKHLYFIFILSCSISWAQDSDYPGQIKSLTDKMWNHYYYEKDSAYIIIDKIYTLAIKNKDNDTQIDALLNYCGVSSYHYDLEKSHDKLKELDSILGIPTYQESDNHLTNQNMLLYHRGVQFLKLYEYRKSREVFESIISNVESTPDSLLNTNLHELASVATSFIGKIHLEEGKYDLARQYYEKDIRSLIKNTPEKTEYIYDNYNLLAEVFREEKKYSTANTYLLKTYGYNKSKKNTNSTISSAFNLAQNYNHLHQRDSALFYLAEAKSNFNDNPAFTWRYHLVKSEIHKKNREYEMARKELDLAIKKAQLEAKNPQNLQIVSARTEIGEIRFLQNRYRQAIENYDLGLEALTKIPAAKAVKLKLLKNKSIALNAIANNDSYLKSLKVLETGIATLDSLKPSFKSEKDKLFLIEDAFPLFESGLEAAYKLYTSSGNKEYIDKAFYFSEKSKSVLLLEALLASKATDFANIPENLLEKEKRFKTEITFIEKQLNKSPESTALKDKLFELKNDSRSLVSKIEREYPTYYDLKYNSEVISSTKTQSLLSNDEAIVSFFYGNKSLYIFHLTKETKDLRKVALNGTLNTQLTEIHGLLSNPKSDMELLAQKSNEIYRSILEPSLTLAKKENLIIIPDGPLNYLPFGALNTKSQDITYLIEKATISYASSSTLFQQLLTKRNQVNRSLALAPNFDGTNVIPGETRDALLPLAHNKREARRVLTYFDGESLIGDNGSLQNFKLSVADDFGILHLATHAVFDDKRPEYSYLAFTPNTEKDFLLYVRDLYNMKINANLVTLSACETGVGELKRGEGFMGLARGFFYSGASSIASTLWKVNDASSTQLMDLFYKNLAHGNSKNLALQKAKIEFLKVNSQNALRHPYFWSGYIVSGNPKPVTTKNTWWPWAILGTLLVALVGFLSYRKKAGNK